MQIVRTIVWVLLLVALVIFSMANWDPSVTVRIWQNLVVETKLPAVVVISFLIGLVPMWLIYRASRWNADRRISALENAARNAAMAAPPPAPVAEVPVAVSEPAPEPVVVAEPAPIAEAIPDESKPPLT
ncbi:MAG: LapA family protein [Croceibacterium sp.]